MGQQLTKIRDVLTPQVVQNALNNLQRDIPLYLRIVERFSLSGDLRSDSDFQRWFNRYYRVRRNKDWRSQYYDLFQTLQGSKPQFIDVITEIFKRTGNVEASFASKLLSTIRPDCPVIDSEVYRKLNLKLPSYGSRNRLEKISSGYEALTILYEEVLDDVSSRWILESFHQRYPFETITAAKKFDLLLWSAKI